MSISDNQGNFFTKCLKMLIYCIDNLHISRMELHINIFAKPCFSPLIAFVPWKYANRILDMSIPHSDNTSLILSVILSLWILWMRLIVMTENQEKMTLNFCQNNLFRFLSLQLRSLHLQTKQYPVYNIFVYRFSEVAIQQ